LICKLKAGLGAASANAQAPSWNMYQPYTSSAFVPFVSSMGPGVSQGAEVNVSNAQVNFLTNGGKTVATATVPVLVVIQTCIGAVCTPTGPGNSVYYMGVSLDRTSGENLVTPNAQLVNGQTLNTFTNVTRIDGKTVAPGSIRQGYIINSANGATGGVTLGLTQQNTQGFSFVKLGANPSSCGWAGVTSTPTPRGRCRCRWSARRPRRSRPSG
jgi:hypothetical protein